MHAGDMLKYGHEFILKALDGLDLNHSDEPGVCGEWSVKDVLAHLASFEGMLIEVLNSVLGIEAPTPFMATMMQHSPAGFNDVEVEKRRETAYQAVLDEYTAGYTKSVELLAQIPLETQRQAGLLKWYGDEYDLEDFLVYTYYAHKREHGAQINVFKDRTTSQ